MKTIFKGIVGSHAFGTNTAESDTDIAEIFICDNNDLLGFKYKEHDDLHKDHRRYELNKFISLLMIGNPNMLEILNLPQDCILETSSEWDFISKHKKMFVTKKLYKTFVGYAQTQITKATGLNKKINWENKRVTRKTVLDFCYIYSFNTSDTKSIPLRNWLKKTEYSQTDCGLVGLDHFKNDFLLYTGKNYSGIVRDEEKNNEVCTSSIPKGEKPICILHFNKEGYSSHCKDYREYQKWLRERNDVRYNTNKKHGQNYDSKNIMHLVRLLNTAKEIALTGKIKLRRDKDEVKYLLDIKNGREDLNKLVEWSKQETLDLKEIFDKSDLPEDVDKEFCHNLVVKIRNGEF